MITKFDAGDEVYIKAKIVGIGITENGIDYDVRFLDADKDSYTLTFKEDDIVKKEEV